MSFASLYPSHKFFSFCILLPQLVLSQADMPGTFIFPPANSPTNGTFNSLDSLNVTWTSAPSDFTIAVLTLYGNNGTVIPGPGTGKTVMTARAHSASQALVVAMLRSVYFHLC